MSTPTPQSRRRRRSILPTNTSAALLSVLLLLLLKNINTKPTQLLQFLRAHAVIGEQAALVTAHAEVVN
jgi:hypothetical protein